MANLLNAHIKRLDTLGFYMDASGTIITTAIEKLYKPEYIKEYFISEIYQKPSGDFIFKFKKRIVPLTDEEYSEKYK